MSGQAFDVDSDDGVGSKQSRSFSAADESAQDEDWDEEEKANQGFKEEEFAFLSDMLGPKGVAFDNDDILDDSDDEDLKQDPVSQMDMQVCITRDFLTAVPKRTTLQAHIVSFLRECHTHNTNNFATRVGQLSADEMVVVHQAVGQT